MEPKSLYLIDGSNLAFRAHCAFPQLTLENGFPIGATYGTISMLDSFVHEWPPGKIVIAFDLGPSRARLAQYPAYKAGRKDDRQKLLYENYRQQLTVLPDLLRELGLTVFAEETEGIEADDVLAYCVALYRAGALPGINRVVVLTSDKDLCALVGPDKVIWYDPMRRQIVSSDNFEETFAIRIEQYPDYKALKGDASDNIPGAKGIGPKNAAKLLKEYGSLDALLQIKHEKVEASRENVLLSRRLVALNLHEQDPEAVVWERIRNGLSQPRQVSPTIQNSLKVLQFESLLEDWAERELFWRAFANC